MNYNDRLKENKEKLAQLNDRMLAKREHNWYSRQCWCEPQILLICPECHFDSGNPDTVSMSFVSCWRCHGEGLVPHDGSDKPAIIVHEHST